MSTILVILFAFVLVLNLAAYATLITAVRDLHAIKETLELELQVQRIRRLP